MLLQIIGVLATTVVAVLVATVLGELFTFLKGKINQLALFKEMQLDDKLMDALEKAVSNVMEKEAAAFKAAAEDGKLTYKEKENLKNLAINEAEILLGEGSALIRTYGMDALSLLIRYIVDRINRKRGEPAI